MFAASVSESERRAAFNISSADLHLRNDVSIQTAAASSHSPRRNAKLYLLSPPPPATSAEASLVPTPSVPQEGKSSGAIITFDPASTCRVGSSERTEHFGKSPFYLSRGVNAAPLLSDSFENIIA